ncbi:MAG: polysaccharide biosynthesis protein [Candidatus Acidiferrales bacterium]
MKFNLYAKPNQYVIDGFIVGVSFGAAYLLRFEGAIPPEIVSQMWGWLPVVVAGRLGTNHLFGTYRRMWRYVSIVDALQLVRPFATFSAILLALRLFLPATLAALRVPLSIILIEGLLSFTGSLSVRLLRRILYQRQLHAAAGWQEVKRVLLVGAGVAGAAAANMLAPRPDRKVVGFLDDDPKKAGAVVAGVPVVGTVSQLRQAVEQQGVNEVVICFSRARREVLKRIWRLCEGLEVRTLIVPALEELMEGEVQVSRLRQVSMEELLGREAVEPLSNPDELTACYRGKRILVTGAGGSIGSELARQLAALQPECLLLLDKDENGLYELSTYFSRLSTAPPIELLVADLRSPERLRSLFEKFRPQLVFHAAAHKHVPLMESNPSEAVLNNVFGTVNLLEQGVAHGASLFVFISTDKAARPASIMGASKRLGELLVESQCQPGKARFACVRFGNVMSSRGSVIPLFQKQIAAGGPVTLTDPEVSRYFMTIPEAVQLVTCVGLLGGENGGTYVLDMKDPIRIADLARDLIELAGLRPGQDIRVETIGLRPGEKLHEELIGEGETLAPTQHPRIFAVCSERSGPVDGMDQLLFRLRRAAEQNDVKEIYRVFEAFPIAFRPPQNSAAAALASNPDTRAAAPEPAGRTPA